MPIPCSKFTDFLSRRSEHLDDNIIRTLHPIDTWVGHVSTGRFAAEDGVEHTFDRWENVFPDLRGTWEDVTAASCVGTPCDPALTKIGLGFTRDSYKLQRKAYSTDIFCFDQILSADRAKQQFAHVIRTLRRASSIISSHRLRTEALRIAKYKWATSNNTLTPITMTWDSTMTFLTVTALPTSKITASHLQRRVQPQIRAGALGEELNKNGAPMLEYVTAMDEIWQMTENNPTLSDHWRFQDWGDNASKYFQYGWSGKLGNYGLRDDTFQLRFNLYSTNGDGTYTLQLIFPYTNVAATEGIKEQVNTDWDNAHYAIDFIWHRMAMTSLVRDSASINPEMPFAARDFAGKWRWAMNNLTCGVDSNGNPIAVDNSWGNKGKFLAMFSFATQAKYPEFAEAFLKLREPACIVDVPVCSADPGYPTQNYSSENEVCATENTVITFLPVLNSDSSTYEIPANTILCNGLPIFHDAITGTASLANLVIQMNELLAPMGTWAVSSSNITLTGPTCQTVNLPWTVA